MSEINSINCLLSLKFITESDTLNFMSLKTEKNIEIFLIELIKTLQQNSKEISNKLRLDFENSETLFEKDSTIDLILFGLNLKTDENELTPNNNEEFINLDIVQNSNDEDDNHDTHFTDDEETENPTFKNEPSSPTPSYISTRSEEMDISDFIQIIQINEDVEKKTNILDSSEFPVKTIKIEINPERGNCRTMPMRKAKAKKKRKIPKIKELIKNSEIEKRGRGRPKKIKIEVESDNSTDLEQEIENESEEELKKTIPKKKSKFGKRGPYKKQIKNKIIQCSYKNCNMIFDRKYKLQTHLVKIHNEEKSIKCDECEEKFINKYNLETHIAKIHPNSAKFKCTFCGRGCPNRYYLELHMERHTEGGKEFKCDLCNKVFKNSKYLRVHINNLHNKPRELCHLCGKYFQSNSALNMHKKVIHEKQARYFCIYKDCDFKSYHKTGLDSHVYFIHTNEYKFVCEVCGRSFKSKRQLTLHNYNHTGMKPYECPDCKMSFSDMFRMKRHMFTHKALTDRPFKCEECPKSFVTVNKLEAHKSLHSNCRNFTCEICSRSFSHQSNLYSHNYHVHKKKEKKGEDDFIKMG